MPENQDIEPEKAVEKQPKKKRKFWKFLLKLFVVLAVVVGVAQYVLYYYAFPLLKEKICQNVSDQTNGLYTINFDDIRLNFLGRSILLTNFTMKADTTVYLQLKEQMAYNRAIYNISVANFAIKNIRLSSIFGSRHLRIKSIELIRPVIRLAGKPDDKHKGKYDAIHKDLYPLISNYFNKVEVKNISVTDGFFDFYKTVTDENEMAVVGNINIALSDFYVDEEVYKTNNRLFYSDKIAITSGGYKIRLADSIHTVNCGDLIIKTSDSIIFATDVKLLAEGPKAAYSTKEKFNVSLDTISITGVDINKAYFKEVVDIRAVSLVNPKISFATGRRRNKNNQNIESTGQGNWYSLIKGTLKAINIDTFEISDASVKVSNPKFTKPAYEVGNVNITLLGFALDSLAYLNRQKILYSNDLDISIRDFDMRLPDRVHLLSSSYLLLSTKQKAVSAGKIRIRPLYDAKDSTDSRMNISVPKLDIKNIDIKKAYNSQIFNVGAVLIMKPQIESKSFNDTATHRKKTSMAKLLSDEYFKSLRIAKITIKDSYIDIDQQSSILEDSLTISGLLSVSFDNFETGRALLSEGEKPFIVSNVNLTLDNFVMKPSTNIHTLKGQNLTVDSRRKTISLSNFSYSADTESLLIPVLQRLNKHSVIDFKVKKAVLSNTNLIQGFYNNKVEIGNFQILNPKLVFIDYPHLKRLLNDSLAVDSVSQNVAETEDLPTHRDSVFDSWSDLEKSFAKLMPKSLNIVRIDTFAVDSGVVQLTVRDSLNQNRFSTENRFKLDIDRFYFDRDSAECTGNFLFADNYNLNINNFQFLLPDRVHNVKASEISLGTKDGFLKSDMVFVSQNHEYTVSDKNIVNAYFPAIDLRGIDFNLFAKTGFLCTDTCLIDKSVFTIVKPENKRTDSANVKKKPPILNKFIRNFQISKIVSDGSKFGIYQNINNISTRTVYADFDLSVDSLTIDSANLAQKGHLISFRNPTFHSENIAILTKNAENQIAIKRADIVNDSLHIHNIFFDKGDEDFQNRSRGVSTVFIPDILVVKPDLESAAFAKTIQAEKIFIDSPEAEFVAGKRPDRKPKFDITKFYNKFNALIVDTLYAGNIRLDIYRTGKNSLKLTNLDFKIIGLDTRNIQEDRFPVKEITTGINDYTIYLKDSLYMLHAGRIEFAPDKNDIIVYNVEYRPTVGRYNFYKLFPYRKSATFLSCGKVTAHNFDMDKFALQRRIDIERLSIDRLALNSYLNRSKPSDTSSIKPNLHEFIRRIPMRITIDTAIVSNSYIACEQLSPEAAVPGILTINDVSGKVFNFTNDTATLRHDSIMFANVEGRLMNKAGIRADFKYFLNSPTDEFIVKAQTDTIFLPDMNPFLENALFARIDDGVMKSADIEFTSNNKSSSGVSVFRYNGLKLSVNKHDSIQPKRRGLLSFLANSLIRTDNPKHKLSHVKKGYIYAKRDPHKSFSSYWIQSVLSGAKATAGFESKEQKDERKLSSKIKDVISIKHHIEEKQRKKQRKQFNEEIKNEK